MKLFSQFLLRTKRFIYHICSPVIKTDEALPFSNVLLWLFDMLFLLLDVLFLDVILDWVLTAVRNCRKLTIDEIKLGKSMFGDSIDYSRIKINNKIGKRVSKMAHAYVLFDIINYKDRIRDDVFIHELVHIWQYQKYGTVYIFRALLAQASKAGYDYGGIEALYTGMISGRKFLDFNFEQQGDIIQNAYLQRKGIRGIDNSMYTTVYSYYTTQLFD